MKDLFECRVKYMGIDEQSGKEVKRTETDVLDAVSFTDAESRMHKEMEQMISGDFLVASVKKASYSEIILNDNEDYFFKVKVAHMTVDEISGKEKYVKSFVLVRANDLHGALQNANAFYEGSVVAVSYHLVQDSPVLDYFPHLNEA